MSPVPQPKPRPRPAPPTPYGRLSLYLELYLERFGDTPATLNEYEVRS